MTVHNWFGRGHSDTEIVEKSVRGSVVNFLGQVIGQVVGLLALIVLARLLTPADFGLVAMVGAVVGIGTVIQDIGLSTATVRARHINNAIVSNLFWGNLTASVLMTALVMIFLPLLAEFYSDPRVVEVGRVLALGFVLVGVTAQHQALLRRAMHFNRLAVIAVTNVVVTAVVSLALALVDAGYWALVFGQLAGYFSNMVQMWSWCDWRPSTPQRHVGTRPLLTFGIHMSVYEMFGYAGRNAHSLLIGKFHGVAEVGLFGRAMRLLELFMGNVRGSLSFIAPASMARLSDRPESFNNYYYKGCRIAVMIVMPIFFLGVSLSEELVLILLGEQWLASAVLLQCLAWRVLPQMLSVSTGWVFQSAGNSQLMMWWGVFGWSAIILATAIGAIFSVKGVAIAIAAASWLLLIPNLWLAFRGTSLQQLVLFQEVWPVVVIALCAIAAVELFLFVVADSVVPWLRFIMSCLFFSCVYVSGLMGMKKQRKIILDVLGQLRNDRSADI